MIPDELVTAMLARADQHVSARRDDIHKLIAKYKELLEQGHSSTVASGLVVMASMATLDVVQACQLLGVAVLMLAEKPMPDPEAVPGGN